MAAALCHFSLATTIKQMAETLKQNRFTLLSLLIYCGIIQQVNGADYIYIKPVTL